MLYNYIRLLYSDNGTITDYSLDNQDDTSVVDAEMVATEDYIYVAQRFPFNNFFVQLDTANTNAAELEIDYWAGEGDGWLAAYDVLDGTSVAGKTLARSGVVQFSPQPRYDWQMVDDSDSTANRPTGLTALTIFNVYWLRIKVTADLSANTALDRICYAFTRSQELPKIDIKIDSFLSSFGTGKTDWDNEIVTASIQLVHDLRKRRLIIHPGQILSFEDVSMVANYRTLMVIYSNLGSAYYDRLDKIQKQYDNTLNASNFSFDRNRNAYEERTETQATVGSLSR